MITFTQHITRTKTLSFPDFCKIIPMYSEPDEHRAERCKRVWNYFQQNTLCDEDDPDGPPIFLLSSRMEEQDYVTKIIQVSAAQAHEHHRYNACPACHSPCEYVFCENDKCGKIMKQSENHGFKSGDDWQALCNDCVADLQKERAILLSEGYIPCDTCNDMVSEWHEDRFGKQCTLCRFFSRCQECDQVTQIGDFREYDGVRMCIPCLGNHVEECSKCRETKSRIIGDDIDGQFVCYGCQP